MNLLALTRYDKLGASSRLRLLQFIPGLEARGIAVEIAPLFDDSYLEALYGGGKTRGIAFAALARRFGQRAAMRRADLVWIEKEILPWLPWAIERALLPRDVPYVCDYDDAVFHNYDLHRSGLVRRLLGHKLDRLMGRAALVVAGNEYLAARARKAGTARVEIVPTVVDADRYATRDTAPGGAPLNIGWIGSPSTWDDYMRPRLGMFGASAARHGARLLAVGASPTEHPQLDIRPWSEAGEVSQIQQMDIGLMPLTDTPWARGKCGYKLIQYMACGVPVIASPVGVNREIVEHGVNGFLAGSDAEWQEALDRLLTDSALRRTMGAAGRRKVEERYSLHVWGPRLADMLHRVAKEGGR